MRSNNTYISKILLIVLFIIYPLGALPFIFEKIKWRKKYAFSLLAIFMGVCSILYVPSGDLYRHAKDYYMLQNMNLGEFFVYLTLKMDPFLTSASYIFAKCNINFEIIRFLLVFFSYQIIFSIFNHITYNNILYYNNKIYFTVFLLFFLSVSFFSITQGLRYGFAMYVMIYGIYNLFFCKKNKGWILILLACLIHFSTVSFLILCIIAQIIKRLKLNIQIVFIIAIAFYFISSLILPPIIHSLPIPDMIKSNILAYITGYWAQDFYSDHSILFRISKILSYWTIFPLLFYFYKDNHKVIDTKIYNFFLLVVLMLGLSAPFGDIFPRFSLLAIPLFLIYLFSQNILKKRGLRIIAFFLIVTFCANIFSFRRELSISREYKLLYSSLPTLLTERYTEVWLDNNVNPDGSVIGLKY